MNRRVLTWGVLLAISAFLIIGIQGSFAQNGSTTNRYKTVEIQTTQYIWELVSGADGHVVCQVVVNHPTRPTNEEAIQACADQIFPAQPTPLPSGTPQPNSTAIPFNLADFFNSVYWRFIATQELTRTIQVPLPQMIVHLTVPPNQTGPYYAIIAAYEPVYGERITGITGILNGQGFTCPSARCQVPIKSDSTLEFWATSSLGDDSQHTQAALVLTQKENGRILEVASLVPVPLFRDACSIAWGLPQTKQPAWAGLPPSPEDLNTMKPYQYLAGKLLASGAVDAKDCPGGGLTADGGSNTCGLQATTQAVIDWQNHYDVAIWEAGRSLGVPPKLIKTLIAQESQFWPGNSRNMYSEYGLGQLSQSGADVALRWDNDLFGSICSGLVYDCSKIYGRLSASMQATMRGGLVRAMNVECADCPHGIDEARAYDSIPLITRTLRSNCLQVQYLMRQHGIGTPRSSASYEDLWRFTLASYHSGYQCLKDALDGVGVNKEPDDWQHVSAYLQCPGSIYYVEEFWKSLQEFDKFLVKPAEGERPVSQPTFSFTPTATLPVPTSTPTPVPSLSHIRVLVYVDANKNNYPDSGERVEGMLVTLTFADGSVLNGTTQNGEVVFDLTGRPVGSTVTVALPQASRSTKVRVMPDGEVPVIFRFEQPVVPPALP